MHGSLRLTVSLLLVTVSVGCRTAAAPGSAVEAFYTAYLSQPVGGLPSGEQLDALRPHLSVRLEQLIDAALECQSRFIEEQAATEGSEKPPFIDGDYFSSLFEGPRSFHVEHAARTSEGWQVPVSFSYDDTVPGWTDVAIVVREGESYVIDDLVFGGAGAFNPPGRLSDSLAPSECR